MDVDIDGSGTVASISPDIKIVTDLSALRHGEHLAGSGFCGCSRDFALRYVPPQKPTNIPELLRLLSVCHSHSCIERITLSHTRHKDGTLRPCSCCSFAHDPDTAVQEYADLLAKEKAMAAVTTKAGKAAFSRWRMEHAHKHKQVQPGEYGRPMMEHHIDDQILDPLHLAELGLPKLPWKYGILNN